MTEFHNLQLKLKVKKNELLQRTQFNHELFTAYET